MSANAKTAYLAGLSALALGCHPTLTAGYWMPDFTSEQTSGGATATTLDLDNNLGVVADEAVLVYELSGDEGRNRLRVDGWRIHGEGTATVDDIAGFEFGGNIYAFNDNVVTTVNMEVVGILWDLALVKTGSFRLRLALGADLLSFAMKIEEVGGVQSSEVLVPGPEGPLSSLGLDYIPVPLIGVGVETEFSPVMTFILRAEVFDTASLGISGDFSSTFLNVRTGLLFGKAKGFWLFTGYRHFHSEYAYKDDRGESTLAGPVASLSLRF